MNQVDRPALFSVLNDDRISQAKLFGNEDRSPGNGNCSNDFMPRCLSCGKRCLKVNRPNCNERNQSAI